MSELEEFLSGKLAAVDVGKLESELRSLWTQAQLAESDGQQGHPSVVRACAVNLILYSTDNDAEFAASNLLSEVIISHPCRALLAIQRQSDKPNLEAWVSARCHPAHSGVKQVCCEQITVRYEGSDCYVLPSSVSPLLIADMPVYLWWRCPELNEDALLQFLPRVDRLLVDSRRTISVIDYLQKVLEIVNGGKGRMVVSDLNWRRLLPWRQCLAESFVEGSFGLLPADLKDLQEVEISFRPRQDRSVSAQVFLFIGWLAVQLGWQIKNEMIADSNWKFGDGGKEVTVIHKEADSDMPPGAIAKLKLTTRKEKSITLYPKPKEQLIAIEIDSADNKKQIELLTPASAFRESELVGRELESLVHDQVFEKSLDLAVRLAQLTHGRKM